MALRVADGSGAADRLRFEPGRGTPRTRRRLDRPLGAAGPGRAAARARRRCWSAPRRPVLRGQRAGPAADPRAAGAARHGGRVLPVRAGHRGAPAQRPAPRATTSPRASSTPSPDGAHRGRGRRPPDLRQRGLPADRRRRHLLQPRAGGAHLRRLAGGLRGDLPPGAGRARRPRPCRGGPHVAAARAARPASAASPGTASRCGPLERPRRAGHPLDGERHHRTSASARRTSSRNSSTRSTTSTTRPAGFLSIDPAGAIVYMNATLAAWLGYDLASGRLRAARTSPRSRPAPTSSCAPPGLPGEVRTDRFDLDLRRRNGHPLPARLYHRVAFGKDGKPGASRTFVLNRSAGAESRRAAARRRGAPRALPQQLRPSPSRRWTATGRIARANASFARLFGTVPRQAADRTVDGEAASRVEPNVADSVERDRPPSEAGARQGGERARRDAEPIEVAAGRRRQPLGPGLAQPGRRRATRDSRPSERPRAGDPLRPRHHGPAPAGAAGRPGPEDGHGRPARRRHRARLQQRAAGDHRLLGPAARQPPADRSGLPGHHADQAERQPGGGPRAPAPGVLAPADPAPGGDERRRGALRPDAPAEAPARRAGRPRPEARPRRLAREGRRQPVRAGDREPRGQRPRRDAGRRQPADPHRQRRRSGDGAERRGTRRGAGRRPRADRGARYRPGHPARA